MDKNILLIAQELKISDKQVAATLELLDGGATVPFISRYRKEVTGSLDEVAVAAIRDRALQLREMDKRKATILKTIESQGKLTDELQAKIESAETMTELEDIYLPYKPKRRTRATIAREKGLEPLAKVIFEQAKNDPASEAEKYISEEKEVANTEEALAGARDIIAEWVNEDQEARKKVRHLFEKQAVVSSKVIPGKEEEGQKYKDYFDWSEPLHNIPSHRLLAMRRAERELIISFDCTPEEERAQEILEKQFVTSSNENGQQVQLAIKDCYKRLLKPSMETEIRLASKQKADVEAINVFAENLRQLLMAAPLGEKATLALDPGFRTGCKVVCLDKQGKLVHHEAIYPNEPQKKVAQSGAIIKHLVEKFNIEAIAIGNGTASRETESFVKSLGLPSSIIILMVNESGASIYSASETAREEFPDQDVTVRGSVSIGRRLMDPLAELVKIDPKSIGVGQYQHDVDQNELKKSLDDVVLSCVNGVGVEVNTASKELLTYVSGVGASIAKNIVKYREENGPFTKRSELKKVARLGDKVYEQAAGFLRIRNAKNPLDASAVHPESYHIVEQMAKDLNCTVKDLMSKDELRKLIKLKTYVTDKVGLPTLQDIYSELGKPGRDPREQFEAFQFAEGVDKMEDLKIGMKLPGIVTNITNFGAFVDIGVHQDGLVHLSQMADQFVKHPSDVVKVHQKVEVTVTEVDINRKRIALSMKSGDKKAPQKRKRKDGAPAPKEQSMEEKLSMLKSKFGK
ncbi:Tex family protein [Flammeovirgaceae bacterium SG7u.111]|nr:Tex family protein [Flammeovirgaceae bacterium SG7u.132]WPO35589.1 Tex family protein [Flammeovirgaceae bacterium SG7u.111]